MGLFGFFNNYDKPGPGVSKDEVPKAAPIRFFEVYFRKFSKLVQLNLIFVIPTVVAAVLMFALYLFPTHMMLQLPSGDNVTQLDVWGIFIVPAPLVLLSPFVAGLTIVTRNFAREEHAFVWSDFWEAVKNNWKYFLLNGLIVYLVYLILGFSLIYYYTRAVNEALFLVPFWLCVVIALVFLFAQYYIPVMFVTFDLKFWHVYRNALVFTLAGLGRNLLITIILGVLLVLIVAVMPVMPLTILLLLIVLLFFAFSFVSYLINFTIYPVIEKYLIKPFYQKMEEAAKEGTEEEKDSIKEKFPELFASEPEDEPEEEDDGEEKFVYVNGRLIRKSELKTPQNDDSEE